MTSNKLTIFEEYPNFYDTFEELNKKLFNCDVNGNESQSKLLFLEIFFIFLKRYDKNFISSRLIKKDFQSTPKQKNEIFIKVFNDLQIANSIFPNFKSNSLKSLHQIILSSLEKRELLENLLLKNCFTLINSFDKLIKTITNLTELSQIRVDLIIKNQNNLTNFHNQFYHLISKNLLLKLK
jgi:hypothetical protein